MEAPKLICAWGHSRSAQTQQGVSDNATPASIEDL
jgi:hypothetical protein